MCSGAAADLQSCAHPLAEQFAKRSIDTDGIAYWQSVIGPATKKPILVPVSDCVICRSHSHSLQSVQLSK